MLWLTGSKGLLGTALSARCKEERRAILETGREIDVGSLNQVITYVKSRPEITHIVNCAAFSEVDAAEDMRKEAHQTNAVGPENLAIAAGEIGAKLIHISTDYVFSGKIRRPLTEQDPPSPCSYYGETKLEGEQRALAKEACVIRTSWIFGANGKNFVSKLLKMLQTQKEIRLTDDQWGRFTYSKDLADAILKMLDRTGLYQFANAGITTKYEFGLVMRKEALLVGYPIMAESMIPVPGSAFPAPCERPIFSAFDTSKIESIVPIRHFTEAVREFLCEQMPAYL